MSEFANILKAIGKTEGTGLSPAERVENYNILERLNAEGRKLSDILKQAEGTPTEDAEFFGFMERAVKDDPSVEDAKRRLGEVKAALIVRMCSQYPEYREAMDEYRKAVRGAYRAKSEGGEANAHPCGEEETRSQMDGSMASSTPPKVTRGKGD